MLLLRCSVQLLGAMVPARVDREAPYSTLTSYALCLTPYALCLTPYLSSYALRLTPYALCLTLSLLMCWVSLSPLVETPVDLRYRSTTTCSWMYPKLTLSKRLLQRFFQSFGTVSSVLILLFTLSSVMLQSAVASGSKSNCSCFERAFVAIWFHAKHAPWTWLVLPLHSILCILQTSTVWKSSDFSNGISHLSNYRSVKNARP